MKEIITAAIPTIISAVITFLLTRRKYLAEVRKTVVEVDTNEIDNLDKAAKIWRELSEEIKTRLSEDIEDLRYENLKIRDKLNILSRENSSLRNQMASLQKELQLTKIENEKLIEQLRQFNDHFKL